MQFAGEFGIMGFEDERKLLVWVEKVNSARRLRMHADSFVSSNLTPEEMINLLDPLSSPMPMREMQIPDPNQLSIPSEPFPRGSFGERMSAMVKREAGGNIRMDQGLIDKGTDITLSSILNQLSGLTNFSNLAPNLDIFAFFGPREADIREGDIDISRKNLDKGREIKQERSP